MISERLERVETLERLRRMDRLDALVRWLPRLHANHADDGQGWTPSQVGRHRTARRGSATPSISRSRG